MICFQFLQKHAILIDVATLGAMPEPFGLPFPEMLYVQAKIANLTVNYIYLPTTLLYIPVHKVKGVYWLRINQSPNT